MEAKRSFGTSLDELRKIIAEKDAYQGFIRSETKSPTETALWVQKYSPKSFIELLSDEVRTPCISLLTIQKTSRQVLSWLKEWDPCVFNRAFVAPQFNTKYAKPEQHEPSDRPRFKTILLSGPPGIGKTTLAHVVARTAGYEPVEINASDDRTASTLLPKVQDVVQSKSIAFGESKPKCLIIDEIDGVMGGNQGCIDGLLALLDDKPNKLKRPIICICNDEWAPALRPLKERAFTYRLEAPSEANLTNRIQAISKKENIKIDQLAMQSLVQMTHCDVRSCLNTLQYLATRTQHITLDTIATGSSNNKDTQPNIFEVWKQIFVETKKSSLISHFGKKQSEKQQSAMDDILQLVQAYDDHDKVIHGLYENYLGVKMHDPLFTKVCLITAPKTHF